MAAASRQLFETGDGTDCDSGVLQIRSRVPQALLLHHGILFHAAVAVSTQPPAPQAVLAPIPGIRDRLKQAPPPRPTAISMRGSARSLSIGCKATAVSWKSVRRRCAARKRVGSFRRRRDLCRLASAGPARGYHSRSPQSQRLSASAGGAAHVEPQDHVRDALRTRGFAARRQISAQEGRGQRRSGDRVGDGLPQSRRRPASVAKLRARAGAGAFFAGRRNRRYGGHGCCIFDVRDRRTAHESARRPHQLRS